MNILPLDIGKEGGWLFGPQDWWIPSVYAYTSQPLGYLDCAGLRGSLPAYKRDSRGLSIPDAAVTRDIVGQNPHRGRYLPLIWMVLGMSLH